jgi:2'-5' RNA ligase superfamily protein
MALRTPNQIPPTLKRLYRACRYAGMVALLRFPEAHKSAAFIVSGGGPAHVVVAVASVLLVAALALPSAATERTTAAAGGKVIAIDVLLEPDQTMTARAIALNTRLRGNYAAGYSLDATHAPHVTLLQRFVRAQDFHAVTAAIATVLATERPTDLQLKANGLDYTMWSGVAVTIVTVERTPGLMRLQQHVTDAVGRFSVNGGTAAAFIDTPPDAEIVGYVETFVPNASGANYFPHVTAGVATEAFVKQLKVEPFEAFTFKPSGVAIYQLGNYGTASKKLWQSPGRR